MKNWKRHYNGWIITHDPMGMIACYRNDDSPLQWCYFGGTLAEIKREIDSRETVAKLG